MDLDNIKEKIVKSDLAVKSLIQELSSGGSSWEAFHSINCEIVKALSQQKSAVEVIERLAMGNPKLYDDIHKAQVEAFREQLEANYGAVKKTTLTVRKLLEEKSKKELFSVRSKDESEMDIRYRQQRIDKENLSNKASSVTDDLMSISQMMASQVSLSEQSLNTLVSSSATVTETQEEFKMMNSLLTQSRKLLSKYGRREVTDKVLIFFALAFFFGCCLYVVLKRLPTIL